MKINIKKILHILTLFLITVNSVAQKTVRYDLHIRDTIVTFSGKKSHSG